MKSLANALGRAATPLAAGSCAVLFLSLPTAAQEVIATVDLEGAQEVPPVVTAATGTVTLTFDVTAGTLAVSGTYTNLSSDITAAHLHSGFIGENGPAVIGINGSGGTTGTLSVPGAPLSGVFLTRFLTGRTYVNVHSVNNAAGELRGQVVNLHCTPELASDPALTDCGGNPARGPRIGHATETFDLALDCSGAAAPGMYVIVLRASTMIPPVTLGLGRLWRTGPQYFKCVGSHAQTAVKCVGGGGMTLPNDPNLVNVSYCAQGFCFDPNAVGRLSNALIQVVEP